MGNELEEIVKNDILKKIILDTFMLGLKNYKPEREQLINVIGDIYTFSPPRFIQGGSKISCNGKVVSLMDKPLVYDAFEVFLQSSQKYFSRDEMIEKIYGIKNINLSERRKNSMRHNVVKLLSRARLFATKNFDSVTGGVYDWFYYDPKNKTWCLIREKRPVLF